VHTTLLFYSVYNFCSQPCAVYLSVLHLTVYLELEVFHPKVFVH